MAYPLQERERIMLAVCTRMEGGESLREACRNEGCSHVTIQRWCDGSEDHSDQYARARDTLIQLKLDAIQDIADNCKSDTVEIAKAKLRIEQERWSTVRLMPKRAGDKVQNEHVGQDGGAIITQIVRTIVKPDG